MKFGYTILYVDSVLDTLAFYEAAFGFKRGIVAPDHQYGELQTGVTRLAFSANSFAATLTDIGFDPASLKANAPPMEIGLTTDDVVAAFDRAVSAGAVPVKSPAKKPWGQTVGYVRDDNGFLIELCSPMPD